MPFRCLVTRQLAEMAAADRHACKLGVPSAGQMLGCGNAFQIGDVVVGGVSVPMMDVATLRDRSESMAPDIAMQPLATARIISLTRP
jgi:hypothetical protein